jgi:hypothetical protein
MRFDFSCYSAARLFAKLALINLPIDSIQFDNAAVSLVAHHSLSSRLSELAAYVESLTYNEICEQSDKLDFAIKIPV